MPLSQVGSRVVRTSALRQLLRLTVEEYLDQPVPHSEDPSLADKDVDSLCLGVLPPVLELQGCRQLVDLHRAHNPSLITALHHWTRLQ